MPIDSLSEACPDLGPSLYDLKNKIVELYPVVKNFAYHPYYHGGFGLKALASALLPSFSYVNLIVNDGKLASSVLESKILFEEDKFADIYTEGGF